MKIILLFIFIIEFFQTYYELHKYNNNQIKNHTSNNCNQINTKYDHLEYHLIRLKGKEILQISKKELDKYEYYEVKNCIFIDCDNVNLCNNEKYTYISIPSIINNYSLGCFIPPIKKLKNSV
jgi:hypothetical protein